MNKSISVVIPNYNGKNLLQKNIPFVISALITAVTDYEIIISDDASTDDSVLFIKESYPHIRLIENNNNTGFAKNINRGISAAQKDLVLLLNSDIELDNNYIKQCLPYFTNPDLFGVMGRIINPANGETLDAAKYPQINLSGINATANYECIDEISYPSFFLSGANALVCRKKLQQLGGFVEIYSPFYGEDVDLSIRAWRRGWPCHFVSDAICYHQISSTIHTYYKLQYIRRISWRNKLFLHTIHLPLIQLFYWFLVVFGKFFVYIFIWKTNYYKGLFDYLHNIKKAFILRAENNKTARFSIYDVQSKIYTEIKTKQLIKF